MTDETRAELRRLFTAMVRVAECAELSVEVIGTEPSSNPWARVSASCQVRESVARPGSAPELPPFTTAQQLAMSVLLGEPVPLAVLIGALEDAGMFADGVLQAVADKARAEERERIAAVCDGCAEACQLGVLSGSDDTVRFDKRDGVSGGVILFPTASAAILALCRAYIAVHCKSEVPA